MSANTCQYHNCDRPAAFYPKLRLSPFPGGGTATAELSGLKVCADHKSKIKIDEIVTDQSWEQLCEVFRQKREITPMRSLTELDWIPIQ